MAVERLLVVLDPPIKNLIREIAHRDKVSMSSVGRDLMKEALEILEDRYWDKVASEREKDFNWQKALTHNQIWKK